MKKMMMALTAAVMMSTGMMGQEQGQGGDAPRMDRSEMMKQRTEQMVKDYGLSEEQGQKLLELNTKYAEKLPMRMMRGPRRGGPGMSGQGGRMQRPERQGGDSLRRMQRPPRQGGERQMPNFEEMRQNMEAYNAELEKVMTPEQFTKYKEDMQQRMQRGPRGGQFGGPRLGRRGND